MSAPFGSRGVSEVVWLRAELAAAGVRGVNNFAMFSAGSFVSEFDERAAAPTLVRCLPSLSDPWMIGTVARYLRGERANPDVFEGLLHAYRQWATLDSALGDLIGQTLIVSMVPSNGDHVAAILELVCDSSAHKARRSIVGGLWRLRADQRVVPVVVTLCADEDVCDEAMSALRRAVGNDNAQPVLARLRDHATSERVRFHAARQERMASNNLRHRPSRT